MSNNLISKSVQRRLAIQQGNDSVEKVEMRTTKFDEIKELKEKIENYDRRHEEDMGYIQHYRLRIAELEKLLKDNNIVIP